MAANEYYHPQSQSPYHSRPDNTFSPSPYSSHSPYEPPPTDARPSPPPSYTSQPPPAAYQRYDGADRPNTSSPFETVFDDHVYPIDPHRQNSSSSQQSLTHQDSQYHGTSAYSSNDIPLDPRRQNSSSQQSFTHPESRYHSTSAYTSNDIPLDPRRQNSSSQQSLSHQDTQYHGASAYSSTDIPLQNRPHKPDDMDNDHVHDAEPGYNQAATQKRRKVRFGELGMFKNNKKRIPFVVYLFTVVQLAVFIGELVKNSQVTGSVIMTKPSFNPMIGPSTYVLINMGARFVPCMHNISESVIPKDIPWPCPNTTSNDSDDPNNQCTLGELCGFGAPHTNDNPYQWFRFILPIFMHAGIIHIGFNLLLQMTIGREMEQAIGSIRFFLVYISAGIFGFVMGGNYGGTGISSTGASGALFGIIALTLLDLLYSWKERKSPGRELAIIMVEIVISFALGLLPGLDNFAHIGGFLMGIALGISVLHSPNSLRTRIGIDTPYTTVTGPNNNTHQEPGFLKNPVGFFKGRKPLWWAWWLIRAGALLIVIIGFILLLQNFYVHHNTCDWCRYLSCIPINDWCEIGNLQVKNTTSKRDLFATGLQSIAPLYA